MVNPVTLTHHSNCCRSKGLESFDDLIPVYDRSYDCPKLLEVLFLLKCCDFKKPSVFRYAGAKQGIVDAHALPEHGERSYGSCGSKGEGDEAVGHRGIVRILCSRHGAAQKYGTSMSKTRDRAVAGCARCQKRVKMRQWMRASERGIRVKPTGLYADYVDGSCSPSTGGGRDWLDRTGI
jgi:hypothetical protein